ncbi:MAG: hypothetical protein AAFZ52_10050, partial [Bacteroidota bacterium]
PFLLLLLLKGFWAQTLVLGGVGALLAWWVRRPSNSGAVPTPFSLRPFEFAVGVRRYWWILAIAIFLLVQGVRVGNQELAGFAYLAAILLACQCCAEPEPEFYVWVHTLSPWDFLLRKLRLVTGQLLVLLAPFAVALLWFFPDSWLLLLVLTGLGVAHVALWVVMKYAVYPRPLNVGEAFFIAFALIMPPLLLVLFPLYFVRARARLNLHLP